MILIVIVIVIVIVLIIISHIMMIVMIVIIVTPDLFNECNDMNHRIVHYSKSIINYTSKTCT